MSAETPKAVPFLSDERIAGGPARVTDRSDRGFVIERPNPPMGPRMVRTIYEAELQRLRGLLEEARWRMQDIAELGVGMPNISDTNQLLFAKDRAAMFLAKLPKPPQK